MYKYLLHFLTLTFFYLSFLQLGISQCNDWVATGGNNNLGNFTNYGVAADDHGNVFMSGYMKDNSTFHGTTFTSNSQSGEVLFLAKLDSTGTLLWTKDFSIDFNDAPYDISSDGTNVYVTTTFSGNITIDNQIVNHSPDGMMIIKIDGQGNVVWYKSYLLTAQSQGVATWAPGITNDASGNVIVTGYISGKFNFGNTVLDASSSLSLHREAVVLKLDGNGNELWGIKSTGDITQPYVYNRGWSVATDSNDDIYIGGLFTDSISFGNVVANTPEFSFSPYILKIKGNTGTAEWIRYGDFEGTGRFGNFYGIEVDNADNVIATGFVDTTITFENQTVLIKGTSDGVIVKYDTNGNLNFVKPFGSNNADYTSSGEFGTEVNVDIYDNIYLTGVVGDSTYFDNELLRTYSVRDAFVAVLSHEGDLKTVESLGSNSLGSASAYGASFDGKASLYVSGFYSGSALYYNDGDSTTTSHSEGIFLWKVCMNTVTSNSSLATKPLDISIFPNPNNGEFNLKLVLDNNNFGTISLLNNLGQVIETQTQELVSGENILSCSKKQLPTGIYFIQIQIDNDTQTLKVIKNQY